MTVAYATDHAIIEQALRNWFLTYSGLAAVSGKVRWAEVVAGRPAKPYGTLQMIADPITGGVDGELQNYNAVTDHLDKVTHGHRSLSLQCRIYTTPPTAAGQPHARFMLLAALASLRSEAVKVALRADGLAFLQQLSSVQAVNEQLGDRWEWRAQVDLEFGYTSIFTDKPATGGNGTYIATLKTPLSEDSGTITIQ